jgi:hypothetical protein
VGHAGGFRVVEIRNLMGAGNASGGGVKRIKPGWATLGWGLGTAAGRGRV